MELRENLEMVEAVVESDGKKVTMTFLDREESAVRQVSWNKQVYRDGKFVDDAEKAEKVEEWADKYFGCSFAEVPTKVGTHLNVYVYDRYNSLWESSEVSKFTLDMVGEIYSTEIEEITVDDIAIRIRYKIDGNTYETKHTFAKYMESMKQWFVDPIKKNSQFKKFEDKYGCKVEDREELIGRTIMVEVKKAFGSACYGEIKKLPKKA